MTVKVSIKYSTTPNSVPGMCTTVTLNTTDTSHSALKAMIEAKYHGWYNVQIVEVK